MNVRFAFTFRLNAPPPSVVALANGLKAELFDFARSSVTLWPAAQDPGLRGDVSLPRRANFLPFLTLFLLASRLSPRPARTTAGVVPLAGGDAVLLLRKMYTRPVSAQSAGG